ncbi:hypothetical protein CsSME_00022076 [Camellia sinensis var. sinensis]
MESSKAIEVIEGCSSCESGWTMYIASPIHEDNIYDDHDDGGDGDDDRGTDNKKGDDINDNDDNESDDSMASDASSGPSHRELPYGSRNASHVLDHSKDLKGKNGSKYSSDKKIYEKRLRAENKVPAPKANSGAKVRKTIQMERK